ncbi:MAG: SUMF1/EgtB/PvdO family nonheme iron enzyme, partial [Myxococcota bacterium]|nr:SUMF1/EgtB/PvdO family nonheme iron enzyme [Myxococcota bacterium]
STYRPYPLEHDPRHSPQQAQCRVVRGGSFRSDIGTLSTALRRPLEEDFKGDDIGFRIVRTL